MAAVFSSVKVGLKVSGSDVSVPDTPKGKLMYYLHCVCSVLSPGTTEGELKRLKDYRHPDSVSSEEDIDKLVLACFLLSPDELVDKCIFQDAEMCGYSSNEFYDISTARKQLVVSESVIIGGEKRQVRKIMCFTEHWLQESFIEPMEFYKNRLRKLTKREKKCTIL